MLTTVKKSNVKLKYSVQMFQTSILDGLARVGKEYLLGYEGSEEQMPDPQPLYTQHGSGNVLLLPFVELPRCLMHHEMCASPFEQQ